MSRFKLTSPTKKFLQAAAFSLATIATPLLTSCATNPETGEKVVPIVLEIHPRYPGLRCAHCYSNRYYDRYYRPNYYRPNYYRDRALRDL